QQEAENKQSEEVAEDREEISFASPEVPERYEAAAELAPELHKMMERFSEESGEPEAGVKSDAEFEAAADAGESMVPVSDSVPDAPEPGSPWGSASKAQKWLESIHPKSAAGVWLAKHRADVYVGAAVVLLLIVLSGWGMRPAENHAQAKSPAQPSLTLFEKLLISMGLAETPPAPVYLGNPNAPVWVDLHTALYYCSDSDLYGK